MFFDFLSVKPGFHFFKNRSLFKKSKYRFVLSHWLILVDFLKRSQKASNFWKKQRMEIGLYYALLILKNKIYSVINLILCHRYIKNPCTFHHVIVGVGNKLTGVSANMLILISYILKSIDKGSQHALFFNLFEPPIM